MVKTVYRSELEGWRSRGRPGTRWKDKVRAYNGQGSPAMEGGVMTEDMLNGGPSDTATRGHLDMAVDYRQTDRTIVIAVYPSTGKDVWLVIGTMIKYVTLQFRKTSKEG